MLYAGKMSGRNVLGVSRGQRSGHVMYEPTKRERTILESGWVRKLDISTGVPLLGLEATRTSRNGPSSWPTNGTPLVIKPLTDEATGRRWCRTETYINNYRRILACYAPRRSHHAHMMLFRTVLQWVQDGRRGEPNFDKWIEPIIMVGGNMALVDRLLLYMLLDLDDDHFLEACMGGEALLNSAPS